MPDKCDKPQCHEELTLCIHRMVPKKTMWAICWGLFVVIVLPFGITAVKVWSQQASDSLRYVEKTELNQIKNTQTETRKDIEHIKDDLQALKKGQEDANRDIKEMLKYLRGR